MATQNVLGFYNIWYPDGFTYSIPYKIDEQHIVRIFSSPYFIASKLEALKSRGGNDGRTSHDFEDIVYVMENRRSLWKEIALANDNVRLYLINTFKAFLQNPFFEEWIVVNVSDGASRTAERILQNIKELINSSSFLSNEEAIK